MQLARSLDRSRFDVHMACFNCEGPLLDLLPPDLIEVPSFPLRGFGKPSTLFQAQKFVALLRSRRIQILQTFDFYTNVFGIPLANLAGVSATVGSRRDTSFKRSMGQAIAQKWSLRAATRIVVNAEAIKSLLVERDGIKSDKVCVIHNGLDLSRFNRNGLRGDEWSQNRDAHVVFVVIGNLRPEKGHLTFLRAAAKVAAVVPGARFVLAGEGPMRLEIERTIKTCGLADKVRLLGSVNNVPDVLAAADVVVCPSDTEGFPNAVVEGMAASKPVVATDTGGTRELVSEGVTGYLVPVGGAEMMAARMVELCHSQSVRLTLGGCARRRVEESFTVEHMAGQFGQLYEELVKESGNGSYA